MEAKSRIERIKARYWYFFPVQLVMLYMKRNHFLLLLWGLLFLIIFESFATKFGIPLLFLAPEYQGRVDIWSFGILGFSLGAFIMSANIYTYINFSRRFPFLGTLNRPFFKFCINNFVFPALFITAFIWRSSRFLSEVELKTNWEIFVDMSAFLFGNALFIALTIIYFFPTNKNIFKITGLSEEEMEKRLSRRRDIAKKAERAYSYQKMKPRWKVNTYLINPFRMGIARESKHYDRETLKKVFYQNHVNASLFEAMIVLVFIFIGAFQYNNIFIIPAAASFCLVFTIILMGVSIMMSWLKGWTFTILIIIFFAVNWTSSRFDILNQTNYAYGLNYENEPVDYNIKTIDSLNNDLIRVRNDVEHHEGILERKMAFLNKGKSRDKKPKLVIVNSSGGGLRATLWAMRSLQYADSLTNGKLFDHTVLMTGASGGIIGSSYFRELKLRRDSLAHPIYSKVYRDKISKDILNRVLFTFATNDIFVRFRQAKIDGKKYTLDRAKTFENQLHRNTDFYLDKKVIDYYRPVASAQAPMIILAPTVVTDGRRLLISSQPLSFLCYRYPELGQRLDLTNENVEFSRLFQNQEAEDLNYSSALRINSTFPYILPYASMPTEPVIEVMDAGLRDNFGMKLTIQYLHVLREWIEENTSGIIVLQIRDTPKFAEPEEADISVMTRITNPIGSFYGNFFEGQDYNMDQLLKMTDHGFNVPIHQIPLEIRYQTGDHIALSWHLTPLEKNKINQSIYEPENQASLRKLSKLLE